MNIAGYTPNLIELVLDAVHFVEEYLASNTGEEKKRAAIGFVKHALNKHPVLAATDVDDKLVDATIELAVGFMNKFVKRVKK